MTSPYIVVYSFVVADLFHYGHLQLLQTAKSVGDHHICGVLTDEAAESYRPRPISNLEERIAVISNINCVDQVIIQNEKDPTNNLKKIHEEYPSAQLILVHGNDWGKIPGQGYVESIGGKVVQPEYYRRLSDSRVRESFVSNARQTTSNYEQFTEHFHVGDIVVYDGIAKHFVMSTKANTLRSLQPLLKKSRIENIFACRVNDWRENNAHVLKAVREKFGHSVLVVRSSVVNEDTYYSSEAGSYKSVLGVPANRPRKLCSAIESVVASYMEKGNKNSANQILIQPFTKDIQCSGVILTRNSRTGAPYYVINYNDQSDDTETVTAGSASDEIEIVHDIPLNRCPEEWRILLGAVREVEKIIPSTPLDIEFGIQGNDCIVIFQVRALTTIFGERQINFARFSRRLNNIKARFHKLNRGVPHLAGRKTAFSDMAFWNPAEMIGDRPAALSISLYKYLITDATWHRALLPLGYHPVNSTPLLFEIGGKPYIDIRATFNALMPKGLSRKLREKLVRHYLKKLYDRPELHDKVEFEIVENCYHFSSPQSERDLRYSGFSTKERRIYFEALKRLTKNILREAPIFLRKAHGDCMIMKEKRNSIMGSVNTIKEQPSQARELCVKALELLSDCKKHGTNPFSRVARMAFLSRSLLESLSDAGYLADNFPQNFIDQIYTVAQQMSDDFQKVMAGQWERKRFMSQYGHLRPGTYDICSPRYDTFLDFFEGVSVDSEDPRQPPEMMKTSSRQYAQIKKALRDHDLASSPEELLQFIKKTFEGREMVKFEFTKNLSDALELIVRAGEVLGISREELAHLDFAAIRRATRKDTANEIHSDWAKTVERNRKKKQFDESFSLPPIFFSDKEFEVVKHYQAKPNFITRKTVKSSLISIDGGLDSQKLDLKGRIVLLEKADPGYDWIFTKSVAGLITKYGGVASHMAIRCSEFRLPAAIGCGEHLYRQLLSAKSVFLHCGAGQIKVI